MLLLQSSNVRSCDDACGVHTQGIDTLQMQRHVLRAVRVRGGRVWQGGCCCMSVASLHSSVAGLSARTHHFKLLESFSETACTQVFIE